MLWTTLRKVDAYADTPYPDDLLDLTYLERIFYDATISNGVHFFESFYIPVRAVTSSGIADTPTYKNCGFTVKELAKLYKTYYRGMYLTGKKTMLENAELLTEMIESVLHDNTPKYLKLLELYGMDYNPLWNVDGEEIRQHLKNEGVNDTESGPKDVTNGVSTEHNVSTYDGTLKSEWKDVSKGKVETTYTHHNAKNGADPDVIGSAESEYVVKASDTAFGQKIIGGDKMEIEKLIRHGNIGVTKTSELIRDQRDLVKFSIIREFFTDINEVILVGIFD